MKISEDVLNYLDELSKSEKMKSTVELIKQDLKKCNTDVTNMILRNKLKLEGSWSSYIATDVNVIYEEDMLRVSDLLTMYGLRDMLPNLKGDDTALIASYKFDLFDAYDNVMDTTNVFHITIKGAIGEDDVVNQWFLLYDI